MTDLIADLNQALYLATPAERRAFMSALLPTISRWLTDAVESCAGSDDAAERQWPDQVMAQLIEPVGSSWARPAWARSEGRRRGCGWTNLVLLFGVRAAYWRLKLWSASTPASLPITKSSKTKSSRTKSSRGSARGKGHSASRLSRLIPQLVVGESYRSLSALPGDGGESRL